MTLRAWFMIWLSAVAIAAGPSRGAQPISATADLGRDLSGEACRWAAPPGATSETIKALPILCGDASEATGQVLVAPLPAPLPADATERHAAIAHDATALPGRGGIDAPMSCDAGETLVPNSDRLLMFCTVQSTGWPRILVISVVGNTLYRGEGLPTMLPVLQAGIAAAAGHPIAPAEAESGLRLIGAKFPGSLEHAGGADVASYKALVELARLNGAQHNYASAEEGYRRALEIEQRLFGVSGIAVGENLAELALQVSNQGRFDEAAGLFRRAQPVVDASSSIAARARLASYLALDAANRRQYGDALKFARQATEMRRGEAATSSAQEDIVGATHAPVSRGELAHSLRIEVMMAMRVGELQSALAAAEEVLRIVNEEPGLPLWWRPDTVMMMADLNARLGRVVEAERQYREALVMNQRLFGSSPATLLVEMKLGAFYSDQQLYTAAVPVLRQALVLLANDEAARASIVPDQILPFLVAGQALAQGDAKQRDALEAEMFRASQLVGSDVAGRTIERASARLAADNTALGDLIREGQDAQRLRDEARIELAAETVKSSSERDPARERKLSDNLRVASARADTLGVQIRAKFPDYFKFADPGPADLADVQHALEPREALLSFVIGQNSSFGLLVTRAGLSIKPLKVTQASLAESVDQLRKAFTPQFGRPPEFDLHTSFALYQQVLGPFAAEIAGFDHLVIVPTGPLASLPFAVLSTQPPGARQSYESAAWLLRRTALSQVPSPLAFLTLRAEPQRRAPAAHPLLALGNPNFTGATGEADGSRLKTLAALAARCQESGPISGDLLRDLPPLTETANEVLTVGRLLGASNDAMLLGSNATEANFRAKQLDQYAVLYFATHGLLPGELHCQAVPALALSPPPSPARTTDEDGLLDASEIAGLKLNADLVVLSACNTATESGEFGGEALDGLADAFFNAGAHMVLASHWEVPSLATVKLMTGLFGVHQTERSLDFAEALRRSQLALIADPATAHPYFWAAFTIIGVDGSPATAVAPSSSRPREDRS